LEVILRRAYRRAIDVGLTGLGMGTIFSGVVLGSSLDIIAQLSITAAGILWMGAGIWHLSNKISPSERSSSELRKEGDNIILLLRQLHGAAIEKEKKKGDEGAEIRFQATLNAMHTSVKRMAELASEEGASSAESDKS